MSLSRAVSTPYKPYSELEFPPVQAWTPAEHYRILHRRHNYAQHRAARPNFSRLLKTKEDFKAHNEDMYDAFCRKWELWKFNGCRSKRPSEPKKIEFKNEQQMVTINRVVSDTYFIETYLDSLEYEKDVYMSQNNFVMHRSEENWLALGALYLDFDNPIQNYGLEQQQLAVELIEICDAEKIPRPSYIMSSGIGLNVVWLHDYQYRPKDRSKAGTINRWKAVEAELHRRFKANGRIPDAAVKDVTRIFRIAGTLNSKNSAIVQPIWINGDVFDPVEYKFSEFADALFANRPKIERPKARKSPEKPAEVVSFSGHKARSGKKSTGYYANILSDLYKTAEGWKGIPTGKRDIWLFIATCAIAQTSHYESIVSEVRKMAEKVGFSDKEALLMMQTAIRRAKDAADGILIEYNGRMVDPRYRFKAETLVELLGITRQEMTDFDLRSIINHDRRQEVDRIQKAARRQQIKLPESTQQRANSIKTRNDIIVDLLRSGKSIRAVASEVGISYGTVQSLKKSSCSE